MLRIALVAVALCGCRFEFEARQAPDAADYDTALATCTDRAQPVPSSGAIGGMLVGGEPDAVGSCGGAGVQDVLYAIDVPAGAGLVAASDGPSTTANTVLYVRTDCADPATQLTCDDQGGIDAAGAYHFTSLAAGRYFVFVDGEAGSTGPFDGEIDLLLPAGASCAGDHVRDRCAPEYFCSAGTCMAAGCTVTETLPATGSYLRTATTSGASFHAGTCGQGSDGGVRAPEVVYRVQLAAAVSDLQVTTDSMATGFDTLVYVRNGCTGPEVGCDDDSGTVELTSNLHTGALAAGDYYIFVDGFSTRSGTAEVTITITP